MRGSPGWTTDDATVVVVRAFSAGSQRSVYTLALTCLVRVHRRAGSRRLVNVEQLRRILARLPADMPVVLEDSQSGWMQNARLYIAPAHIDRHVSGNYLRARNRKGRDNFHALLISAFRQSDKVFADITPASDSLSILDAEVADERWVRTGGRKSASQPQARARPPHRPQD